MGAIQGVQDASIYILHLPAPSFFEKSSTSTSQITGELKVHFNVLRANPSATLIVVGRMLPEPGSKDPHVEADVRSHDLCLLQMTNDQTMETAQLLEILDSVRDGEGRFAVANRLSTRTSGAVALQVKIRSLSC